MTEELKNTAYIDGQNLHLSTQRSDDPWKIDSRRFRIYLQKKYNVGKAYYFIGCFDVNQQDLYSSLQSAGYILVFRAHSVGLSSSKKGNVDTDIVFNMMRDYHEHSGIEKFYLISGDGDYYKTVKYLLDNNKFGKILFPARDKASSLYRQLDNTYYDYLDKPSVRKKIEYKR